MGFDSKTNPVRRTWSKSIWFPSDLQTWHFDTYCKVKTMRNNHGKMVVVHGSLWELPSGKHLHNYCYGKSCSMGKLTAIVAIFNGYVKLPEGTAFYSNLLSYFWRLGLAMFEDQAWTKPHVRQGFDHRMRKGHETKSCYPPSVYLYIYIEYYHMYIHDYIYICNLYMCIYVILYSNFQYTYYTYYVYCISMYVVDPL